MQYRDILSTLVQILLQYLIIFGNSGTTEHQSIDCPIINDGILLNFIYRSSGKTDAGKKIISKTWNLCTPLKTNVDVDMLVDWLTNVYINIAMVNYPYPTNFLVNLPGNPLRGFCEKVKSVDYKDNLGLLKALKAGINFYTNYTGQAKCVDIGKSADNLGEQGWNFQVSRNTSRNYLQWF